MIIPIGSNPRNPRKCSIIFLISMMWLYIILGNLINNSETQQEIYRLMKQKDLREGKVHNLMRASLSSGM